MKLTQSERDRFWSKVRVTDGCWLWTAACNEYGYGLFRYHRRMVRAHRVAYSVVVGPIRSGHVVHHNCNNPTCVNPFHLEAVTQGENIRRIVHRRRTHCPHGHRYDKANTYHHGGRRFCRACRRERVKRWTQRRLREAAR